MEVCIIDELPVEEIIEKAYHLEHSVKGTLDVPSINEDAKPLLIYPHFI
jgi:hypothetical protein